MFHGYMYMSRRYREDKNSLKNGKNVLIEDLLRVISIFLNKLYMEYRDSVIYNFRDASIYLFQLS